MSTIVYAALTPFLPLLNKPLSREQFNSHYAALNASAYGVAVLVCAILNRILYLL